MKPRSGYMFGLLLIGGCCIAVVRGGEYYKAAKPLSSAHLPIEER